MTLHTINAGGFSAVADAFALDDAEGLWFLSMGGSENALKAIWACLLKQPPEAAFLIQGLEGAFVGEYRRCQVPYETLGTWTAQMARLPGSGGYHALVFPRLAEYTFDRQDFLLLAHSEEDAPSLHYRFLDRRVPLPLHPTWARWLWERGLRSGEIDPVESVGILAYRCSPNEEALRTDLSDAVGNGDLAVPSEGDPKRNGHSPKLHEHLLKGGKK